LLSCSYGFAQEMDRNGKAQSEVQGGNLNLTYCNVPSNELLGWMLKSGKLEDGVLVICDANDVPLEKLYFEGAALTNMEVGFLQKGNSYITTKLRLQVRKLTVGSVSIEKKWVNLI
jgi:hypothetical protein